MTGKVGKVVGDCWLDDDIVVSCLMTLFALPLMATMFVESSKSSRPTSKSWPVEE